MNYKISEDRKRLTIKVTRHERALLRRLYRGEMIHSDSAMYEFLERLTCNSELEWIPEGTTGDLTSAPMLGILGDTGDRHHWALRKHFGLIQTEQGDDGTLFQGIIERWAFMDYQVRSVLEDLRDKGEAIFTNGE